MFIFIILNSNLDITIPSNNLLEVSWSHKIANLNEKWLNYIVQLYIPSKIILIYLDFKFEIIWQ